MASEASHIKTVCCMCQVLLSGLADAPETSHGIGPCCWAGGGSVSTPLAARSEVRA